MDVIGLQSNRKPACDFLLVITNVLYRTVSKLSQIVVYILEDKRPLGVFEPPLDLGTAYDVHLRLIGKIVVDFPLVLIELLFARCYGRGATSEY